MPESYDVGGSSVMKCGNWGIRPIKCAVEVVKWILGSTRWLLDAMHNMVNDDAPPLPWPLLLLPQSAPKESLPSIILGGQQRRTHNMPHVKKEWLYHIKRSVFSSQIALNTISDSFLTCNFAMKTKYTKYTKYTNTQLSLVVLVLHVVDVADLISWYSSLTSNKVK